LFNTFFFVAAKDVAAFIKEVNAKTGKKVDIVGHSEGGVMAIYVPMTQPGIKDIVERTVALGPAIHGAKYFGFTDLWYFGGDVTRTFVGSALKLLGCAACDDMATDGAVFKDFQANAGKIAQPGIKTTIVTSKSDTLVASETSLLNEPGVRNVAVQDHCADDKVGHAGLMWVSAFLFVFALLSPTPAYSGPQRVGDRQARAGGEVHREGCRVRLYAHPPWVCMKSVHIRVSCQIQKQSNAFM
jgi:pimeloyl-ACP methyl ester carboxylesterase